MGGQNLEFRVFKNNSLQEIKWKNQRGGFDGVKNDYYDKNFIMGKNCFIQGLMIYFLVVYGYFFLNLVKVYIWSWGL